MEWVVKALHDVKVTMLRVGVANAYWIIVMHTNVCNYCNYYNYYYY
jgi:hypothetical protein